MATVQEGQIGMLQIISSIITILLSGVVAATAIFIMNSSKEHNFQLRQKGEDLIREILILRSLLIDRYLIPVRVSFELQAEMESIVEGNGKYKDGKTIDDEDKFMMKMHNMMIQSKNDLEEKISQSLIKIELNVNLYFRNNISDFKDISEIINATDSEFQELTNKNLEEDIDTMEEYKEYMIEMNAISTAVSETIRDKFEIILGKTIKNVSIYAQREIIIPNIFSNGVMLLEKNP